jgi:outer membrane protein OmpA-like peptidoglycan-associated protein
LIGRRSPTQRRGKDEAEKPFWISYADLMTALMVLFLVVMAVALLAVTRTISEREQREAEYKADVTNCMALAVEAARRHAGVRVDLRRNVIDFGDRARFAFNSSLLSPEQEGVLRRFVPELLAMADNATCKRVLKRIVVEGYTDKTGNYLANLNLSLMRSQRVLCAMFKTDGPNPLSDGQKQAVRDVFLVGGFAFNSSKDTDEESRRVEMRIEFLGIDEKTVESAQGTAGGFGTCAI